MSCMNIEVSVFMNRTTVLPYIAANCILDSFCLMLKSCFEICRRNGFAACVQNHEQASTSW